MSGERRLRGYKRGTVEPGRISRASRKRSCMHLVFTMLAWNRDGLVVCDNGWWARCPRFWIQARTPARGYLVFASWLLLTSQGLSLKLRRRHKAHSHQTVVARTIAESKAPECRWLFEVLSAINTLVEDKQLVTWEKLRRDFGDPTTVLVLMCDATALQTRARPHWKHMGSKTHA